MISSLDLTELASDLASNGFAGREHAVRQVIRAARQRHLPAVLIDVLADGQQPEVARLRAFGRIARLLVAPSAPRRVVPAA